ncbi:predicted protein [Coccidioides posadasii str. Silveira]|uniref:Predicted protein n=1 Tax=Coccidioides posadasii (strain RMSCC 757 / Silveira) TaxID=443226 RepID=E9CSB3_COCPS|nr:predicted protein [Coccidioides posadasii str. Silveira]
MTARWAMWAPRAWPRPIIARITRSLGADPTADAVSPFAQKPVGAPNHRPKHGLAKNFNALGEKERPRLGRGKAQRLWGMLQMTGSRVKGKSQKAPRLDGRPEEAGNELSLAEEFVHPSTTMLACCPPLCSRHFGSAASKEPRIWMPARGRTPIRAQKLMQMGPQGIIAASTRPTSPWLIVSFPGVSAP